MNHRGVMFLLVSLALAGRAAAQVPTIEQISPAAVSVDETTRVTLTGTGFAEGAWVEIEPGDLNWRGRIPFQSGQRGLAVHRDAAAVLLAQPGRLQTWDVRDPERPGLLASLALPADPGAYVLAGDFLFVGLSSGSLVSVDLRSPTAPVVAGTTSGTGQILRLAASSGRLFLVRSGVGLEVLDVTDPANVAFRSSIPASSVRSALAVEGNRLYFTDAAGVQIWDLTDVSAPVPLGVVLVAQVSHIAVRGNRLVETATFGGMRLVDVTDPASPVVVVPRQSQMGFPLVWNASGLLAQLTWPDHGVTTLMLVDPDTLAPRRMLAMTTSLSFGPWTPIEGIEPVLGPGLGTQVPVSAFSFLNGPIVAGARLYWPGEGALRIYDFSDPDQTAPLGSLVNPSGGSTRAADESRAFVAYEQSVRVLDVSNPSSPAFRGTCPITYFNPLFAEGGVAYGFGSTAAGYGWRACDARGAGAPVVVAGPMPEGTPLLRDGSRMFGVGWPQGFLVYDGSDPLRPVTVGSAALPPEAPALDQMAQVGDRIYATSAAGDLPYLLTFDVTNPAAPRWSGSLLLPYPIGNLRAGEGALHAIASDGLSSLIGFDVSDPDHPRFASRMLPFGSPGPSFYTFTTSGPWAVVGYSGSAEAPYFNVLRPNGTIRNFVRESDTRLSFDVPAGWAAGPYHVRVVQPDGTSRAAFRSLTACALEDVEATLAPSPDSPRWRVAAPAGITAALRLPAIAADADVSVEPEEGPDRIELFLASDGAAHVVRLKGPDGGALQRTFQALRGAGEIPWPTAGPGSFGDVDLSARARGRGRQADLVYTLAAGSLQGASANRAGIDLVTVVRGSGACATEAELSYLETLAELCATSAEPTGALAGACRSSRRLPSLARDPGATGPVPFGR